MASTVFELSLGVIVFTLTIALRTFPASADQKPCNAVTTCRLPEVKKFVKSTVSAIPYYDSEEEDYSEFVMDVRNQYALNYLNNEIESVTSGPTCTADSCSAEEASACEQLAAAPLEVETATAAAVMAVRQSCPGVRDAAVAFIRDHHDQVMASQGWAAARRYHPEEFYEVYRLVAEATAQISTLATAGSQPTTEAQSQPHSDHSQTPVTAAPPTTPLHTPSTDGVTDTPIRDLSAKEKARRLIQAAKDGAVEILRALLEAGANVDEMDGNKNTILHLAAAKGHVEIVRSLLEGGAEVDAMNIGKLTPLHFAARWGHAAVIKLLAASSADPNARDWEEWTPLHYAARWGHAEVAEALLQAGADKGAMSNKGFTPLDIARENNQQQIVDLLT